MISWRKARNVALASLVVAGAGGVATAALAGAAPAPWVHLRVCNTASVAQTFHIDGTNQLGQSVQTPDRSLAANACVSVTGWRWQIHSTAVVKHRSSAHPTWATDNNEIWSDTRNHSTVTVYMGVNDYLNGSAHLDSATTN